MLWLSTTLYEPVHDKTYKMACAPSEESRSAWVFARSDQSLRCALSWVAKDQSFPHSDSKDSDLTRRVRADVSLRWVHMPFCRFCHALANMILFQRKKSFWVPFLLFPFQPKYEPPKVSGTTYFAEPFNSKAAYKKK